jgi:hypothetical protein
MFFETQPEDKRNQYSRLLNAVGSLSKLFSESPEPYLASRATENIFCKAFEAENLSRSDASADASKDRIGFGIKTFLDQNGRTMQKVAEFNSDHSLFNTLPADEKIRKIAELRNERILSTKRIFGLDNIIYHCITRRVGRIIVYETSTPLIDIEHIRDINTTSGGASIQFKDNSEDYSFNVSKSTLYKRFITDNILLEVPVRIINDPYDEIVRLISETGLIFAPVRVHPHVFLPLYSTKGGIKRVPEKSGLNQWNASGRPRDPNEIYIPIPAWIHRSFPGFFPARDVSFFLTLPDGMAMSAKVCQDNDKALMSNPNSVLGNWLLRNVMNLPERELLTYDKLQTIGLDAVVIYKIDNTVYDIDFTRIGSYESFASENGERVITEDSPDDED